MTPEQIQTLREIAQALNDLREYTGKVIAKIQNQLASMQVGDSLRGEK
jgi:hypothetical protein